MDNLEDNINTTINFSSDEDKNNSEEKTFDELYPEEEMDDETLKIIYNASQRFNTLDKLDENTFYTLKKTKKKQRIRKNKVITNNTKSFFSQKIIDSNKPKKWQSKRLLAIKKQINKTNSCYKRKFNPRLPPPNKNKKFVEKKTVLTMDDFPEL